MVELTLLEQENVIFTAARKLINKISRYGVVEVDVVLERICFVTT